MRKATCDKGAAAADQAQSLGLAHADGRVRESAHAAVWATGRIKADHTLGATRLLCWPASLASWP